jgi:small subunit ribosomal protein S1
VPKEFPGINGIMGQKLTFKIVKINKPRKNVVLSRKDYLHEEREKCKQEVLAPLRKGL